MLSFLLCYCMPSVFPVIEREKCVEMHQERPPNKYNVIASADVLCCIGPDVSLRAQVSQRVQLGCSRHLTYWMAHKLNR